MEKSEPPPSGKTGQKMTSGTRMEARCGDNGSIWASYFNYRVILLLFVQPVTEMSQKMINTRRSLASLLNNPQAKDREL